MKGCWASGLGNCGGGISREHLVSESVFPNQSIYVQGMDWCLDAPKLIRIESLTAKVLCKDHNSLLSELDATAGRAFNVTIPEFVDTTTQRSHMPYLPWAPKYFTIDGPTLERWCLKTLLNFAFNRELKIGPGSHTPGVVPGELARIAFGLEGFSQGCGLYIAFKEGETFHLEHRFGYTAKAQDTHLVMSAFHLYGFRFYLNLFPKVAPYTRIEDSQVFYRRAHFAQRIGAQFSHQLSISRP